MGTKNEPQSEPQKNVQNPLDNSSKMVYTKNVKKGKVIHMTKTTLTEQINSIAFDTLTTEQFEFLKERALKSIRKASGERKPTKVQKANEGIKAQMVEVLGEGMTATDAGKAVGISVQKASALLKQMVEAGEVVRVQDKKTVLFKAAE